LNPFDLLIALLSVAVAFGGFTGVVALIDRKAAHVSHHVVSFRVRFLIVAVMAVIALTVLPFLLAAFRLPDEWVWRVCCAFYSLIGAGYILGMLWSRAKLKGPQLEGLSTVQFNLLIPPGALCVGLSVAAAAGLVPALGTYLVGIFYFVLGIASLFLRLVLMLDDSWRNHETTTSGQQYDSVMKSPADSARMRKTPTE